MPAAILREIAVHSSQTSNGDLEAQESENRERIKCRELTKAIFKWGPGTIAATNLCMRLFSCNRVLDGDCQDEKYITPIEFLCFIYTAPSFVYEFANCAVSSWRYTYS